MRATTGTAIQQTNCHPFRHGKWLFVRNGVIADFEVMRRELMLAVAPELFAGIKGSTDSEVLFHLALTYGLEQDPIGALEQAIGFVEATAAAHGIENAVQASLGLTDGERLWRSATRPSVTRARCSSPPRRRRSTRSTRRTSGSSGSARRTASSSPSRSPTSRASGTIPESTVLIVQPGPDEQRPLRRAQQQ